MRDIEKSIRGYFSPQRDQDAARMLIEEVTRWLPISSAPVDGTAILGYCDHEADKSADEYTDYNCHCDAYSHVPDGFHVVAYVEAYEESDGWENPSYMVPGGWFTTAEETLCANPTHWMPLPEVPK